MESQMLSERAELGTFPGWNWFWKRMDVFGPGESSVLVVVFFCISIWQSFMYTLLNSR